MYKSTLVPEMVEKGCECGFCEPPESLLDELRTAMEKKFEEILVKHEEELSKLAFDMMVDFRSKIDEDLISDWALHCFMDRSLEMACINLQCDVLHHSYRKYQDLPEVEERRKARYEAKGEQKE